MMTSENITHASGQELDGMMGAQQPRRELNMILTRKTIVIVEGMDNTGKSTLVEKISREFDLPIIHSPGPHLTGDEMEGWVMKWLMHSSDIGGLIFDRIPLISEEVYGRLLRGGESRITPNRAANLWDAIEAHNPAIVYCRPPIPVILETMAERDQMEGVPENAADLIRLYDDVIMGLHLQTLGYSWATDSVEGVFDYIRKAGTNGR